MKKTKLVTLMLSTFLILGLAACAKPTDSTTKTKSNKDPDNAITENITTKVTWDGKDANDNPLTYYINSSIYIKDGGNLNITDGAIVKFGPNGAIFVSATGAITATGAKFTSYRDPAGRTISVAPDSSPAAGDWKQIAVQGGTGKFTSCKFYYGGKDEISTLVASKTGGKIRVDKCEFRYNDGTHATNFSVRAALRYTDEVTYDAETNCVTNSVFENNVWPLSVPAFFSLDSSNTFGTTNETKNEYNYVHINSYQVKVNNAVWDKQNVPYLYVGGNALEIYNGGKLTINGIDDQDDPTVLCFATKGLTIDTGGELDVNEYVTFTNSPESSGTKYNGLYCSKDYKFETTPKTVSKVLLIPNGKIQILEYQPGTSTDWTADNRQEPIKTKNIGGEKNY